MSDTTRQIDTADGRQQLIRFIETLNFKGGATMVELYHLANQVGPLIEHIDALTAQLAAVEREREALRLVVESARAYRDIMPIARYQDEQGAERSLDAALTDYDALTAATREDH